MIKKLIKNNLFNQIIKFGLVGGIAFIIDYIILIICKEIFNLSVLLSAAIAFTISVIFNYIASVKWVFEVNKENDKKKNFIVFIILSIIGLILTEIIMWFGTDIIRISYLIVKIFATAIVMVFNFITRKIFLEKKIDYKQKNIIKKIEFLYIPVITLMSYTTLCITNVIEAYNVISLIILYLLYDNFKKYLITNKKYKELKYISIFLAILTVFGSICNINIYNKDVDVVLELFNLKSLFKIIGFYGIYNSFLNMIIEKISKMNTNTTNNKQSRIKVFIICTIIFMICWLPYLLNYFPGTLSADSIGNLKAIIENNIHGDHHTIAHLLFIKLAYFIGMGIFNKLSGVVLTYSLIQMLLMAIGFSYSITFLYNKNVNKKALLFAMLFYCFVPIFGFYGIVMWKDILFGVAVLLLTIECYKLIEHSKISTKNAISFTIISIITLFLRNNAIYMYYILALITIIVFRKQLKKIIIILLVVFLTYFTIKGPLYSYFDITKSASAEYIGIPMQQIGRMIYKDKKLTKSEVEKISKILDVKIIKGVYNPTKSDDIKFHEDYNGDVFNENKADYLVTWLGLVAKYPTVAIESYAISTLGYWYPNTVNRTHEVMMIENDMGLQVRSMTPSPIQRYMNLAGNNETPILSLTWSMGLIIWIMGLLAYFLIKKKEFNKLYFFVPTIGVWISIMLATPVYNEVRYVFCLYTTLPFILITSLYKINKQKNQI